MMASGAVDLMNVDPKASTKEQIAQWSAQCKSVKNSGIEAIRANAKNNAASSGDAPRTKHPRS